VLRLVRWSAGYLERKGVAESQARLDAEHLLAHALATTRLQLYLQFDRPLTPGELERYKPLLLRRANREPLQYILGRGAFRELDLRVDPRVLVPRPETEELVEAVLEWARRRVGEDVVGSRHREGARTSLPWSSPEDAATETEASPGGVEPRLPSRATAATARGRVLTVLDVGTGSGCIALSLALEGPFRRVVATDPSPDALAVARENASESGLDRWVEFREGPLFGPLGESEAFDVVVSNPPYVARSDAEDLEPEVRRHEPEGALFAGDDGLEVTTALVSRVASHVTAGGLLALEVGSGQAPRVVELIRVAGGFDEPRVRRDLAGRPRMVLAERR
jgi:release factor glutamine methyltransferase